MDDGYGSRRMTEPKAMEASDGPSLCHAAIL